MYSVKLASFVIVCLAIVVTSADAKEPVAKSQFFATGEVDASRLLPPPPADGSSRQKEELAELHRIEEARTPEALAQAKSDAANETVTMFSGVLGTSFDIAKLPATARLFADIAKEEEAATGPAKDFFHRARPYLVDPSLNSCAGKSAKSASGSYPSGHATVAYAMGIVLASLVPSHAQDILKRASEFAENRLVCGVHYRSDITAGETFGSVLAVDLLRKSNFQREYEGAERELRAAHAAGL